MTQQIMRVATTRLILAWILYGVTFQIFSARAGAKRQFLEGSRPIFKIGGETIEICSKVVEKS